MLEQTTGSVLPEKAQLDHAFQSPEASSELREPISAGSPVFELRPPLLQALAPSTLTSETVPKNATFFHARTRIPTADELTSCTFISDLLVNVDSHPSPARSGT